MQSRTPVTFIDFSFVLPSFAALFKKDFNLVKNKQKNPPRPEKNYHKPTATYGGHDGIVNSS